MSAEIKIKEEPVDPEYDKVVAKIKSEPEDIPDNFFDDIENNQFLNELIDNVGDEELGENVQESVPPDNELAPEDDGNDSVASDELPIQEQIEKLTRAIRRREKKLAGKLEAKLTSRLRSRSRSPRRVSRRRRSRSRDRRRSRSRSYDRRRSKSRDTRHSGSRERHSRRRSRSFDRTSRSSRRSRSRSRGHYSRSIDGRRQRSSSRSKSGKKMSFLEELEKIFAAKGQSFPEASKTLSKREKEAILEEVRATSSGPATDSFSSGPSVAAHLQQNYNEQMQQIPPLQLPMPIQIKSEPADYNETGRSEVNDIEPPLKKIKVEKEEESVESRREKVIKMCAEAIEKLQVSEESPLKVRFFYTPAVMGRSGMDESLENRSPLNQICNVQFKFNSATNADLDLEQWGLWKLSGTVSNVIREIGYDVAQLIDKLSFKDIPTALKPEKGGKGLKKDGKPYTSFYTDSGTQTDEATCSTCIIRQLRKFIDKGVQAKPYVGEVAVQTEGDDDLPIMNILALLNSSQLMALNDFSEIIRCPAPTNTAELYRLREKLMDIYNLSQRPCMVPAKVSTAQAAGFNVAPSNQYFNNVPQPCPPVMYPMQPQPNMNPQFHYQPGPPQGGMLPFQHNMPMQPPFQEPQPVPPPNMNIPTPVIPRRDDPRVMRDRERSRDIVPPPPTLRPLETSSRSYGRGAKSFSSSRR